MDTVVLTPVTGKRELSVGTPSPKSSSAHPPKKVKVKGCGDEETDPFATSVCSERDVNSVTLSPLCKSDMDQIVRTVLSTLNMEIKSTICECVNTSVTSMAQSIADVISTSLTNKLVSLEAENRRLSAEVAMLSTKVQSLEQQQWNTCKDGHC